MSEDLTSIGIGVDTTQINSGTKALDSFSASTKSTATELSNYQQKVLAALQAQHGMTEAQAMATAGIKQQATAVIVLSDNLKVNMALTKQRATEAIAAEAQLAAAQLAAAKEAAVIAKQQIADQTQLAATTLAFNMRMTKQRAALAAEEAAAVAKAEAEQTAAVVTGLAVQDAALKINSLTIRESIVLARELGRGDFTRMAGSASLLAQSMGLVTASTVGTALAFAAMLIPFGLVILGFVKGQEETTKFNQALSATNNFAGFTQNSFEELSHTISGEFNQGIGSVKKGLMEVISSGKYTHDTIVLMIQDATLFSQQTGISIDKVMQSYEEAKGGVVAYAVKQEEVYHNITLAQIDYIQQLEKEGQHQEAEKQYFQDIHDNIVSKSIPAYGWLQTAVHDVATAASNMWDALLGIGRPQSFDTKIQDTAERVAVLAKGLAYKSQHSSDPVELRQGISDLQAVQGQLEYLQYAKKAADDFANRQSQAQVDNDNAIRNKYDNQAHKFPKGRHSTADYTTSTQEIADFNDKLNAQSELYGVFDRVQAEAITQQNAEIQTIEKKKDAKGHEIDLNQSEIDQIYQIVYAKVQQQEVDKAGLRIYEQLNGAAIAYNNNVKAIALGLANGNFTPAEAKRATAANDNQFKVQSDPTFEVNRNLDEQIKLYSILGPQRTIQKQLDDVAYTAMQNMQPLTQQELSDLAQKLELAQEEAELDTRKNALLNQSYTEQQRQINLDLQALNIMRSQRDALGQLVVSSQQYQVQLRHIEQTQLELNAEKSGGGAGGFAASMVAGLHKLLDTGKTVSQQLTGTFGDFFSSVEDGVANSFGKWLTGAETLSQALKEVATEALQGLISGLIKIGEQQLINAIIGKTIQASTDAVTLASQIALAPVLATNALNMSIISFGAASVAGGAAYASAQAVGKISDLVGLFVDGGMINGPGGPRDDKVLIAASNGEFIVNAEATARNRSLLEYINNSKSSAPTSRFASGGLVGQTANNNAANDQPTYYNDFRGANFGGADPDVIMQRVDMAMRQVYGPQIVRASVQTSLKTGAKLNSRQTMNAYGSKA